MIRGFGTFKRSGSLIFTKFMGEMKNFQNPEGALFSSILCTLCTSGYSLGIRWYVGSLERSVGDVLRHFGLKAQTSRHTGVWTRDQKICAIGIHCSRYVTSHGLALNCDVDLSWFSHIAPCGLDKGVTSLSRETETRVRVEDAVDLLLHSFCQNFNCDLQETTAPPPHHHLHHLHV